MSNRKRRAAVVTIGGALAAAALILLPAPPNTAAGRTIPYVLRPNNLTVTLDTLIPASDRKIAWTADGRSVPNGRFTLSAEPAANHVSAHRVTASTGGAAAESFTLVVIPTPTEVGFQTWLQTQQKDMAWIRGLPAVYSRLAPGGANPEPETCSPRRWPVLRSVNTHYHPGAAYEMRSEIQEDGSGHQATYDANGELLRTGAAAGSADRAAPRSFNPFRLIAHRDQDVIPFLWAAQLDGNPVNPKPLFTDFDSPLLREGDRMKAYFSVRPSFHPTRRELPPGVCADGRAP